MDWKKRALKNSRLCLILDKEACGRRDPALVLREAVRGGVDMVQCRDKAGTDAEALSWMRRLRPIIRKQRILWIINDRLDVAMALEADGVHLGQKDMPINEARRIAGSKMLLGLSTSSEKEIRAAINQQVDYLGFGPVFPTQTKTNARPLGEDRLRRALRAAQQPVYAIGGMTRARFAAALRAGATRFAVCRDICCASDVFVAAKKWKDALCTLI